MTFVPSIINYKPFYVQTQDDVSAIDTAHWGLIAKSNPYPVLPSPKQPYKNEWKDEDGDDEFLDSICYSALSFSVLFYVKAFKDNGRSAKEVLISQIDDFFNKIKAGEFKIYDSYTGIGYRKVRYESFTEESFKARGTWARSIFKITFKVNDPITRMTIGTDGSITEI